MDGAMWKEGGKCWQVEPSDATPSWMYHNCGCGFRIRYPIGTLCDWLRRVVAVAEMPGTGDADADNDADPNADAYRDDPAILLLIRGAAPRSGLPQDGHKDAEPHVERYALFTRRVQATDRSLPWRPKGPAYLDDFESKSNSVAQAR